MRRRPQPIQPLATPLDEYLLPQYQQRAPLQEPGPDTTGGAGQAPATAPQPAAPISAPQAPADPNIQPDTAVDEDGELTQWLTQQAAAGEAANAAAVTAQRTPIPAQPLPVKPQPDTELAEAQQSDRVGQLIGNIGRGLNIAIGNHAADGAFADLAKPGTSARDLLARRAAEQQTQRQAQAQQELTEQTDPASATNRRYQAVLADRFPDIEPDVLANITVRDVQTNGLLTTMAAARDRASTLAQQLGAQQAMLDDRQTAQMQLAEYNQGQQNARNEADNAAAMARAQLRRRASSGSGGGTPAANPGQTDELVEAMRNSIRSRFDGSPPPNVESLLQQMTRRDVISKGVTPLMRLLREQTQNVSPQEIQRRATHLSDKLVQSGILQTEHMVNDARSALRGLNDQEMRAALLGENAPPDLSSLLNTPKVRVAVQRLARLRNHRAHEELGAAMTNTELGRFDQAMGQNRFASREQVEEGLNSVLTGIRTDRSALENAAGVGAASIVSGRRDGTTGGSVTPPRQDGKVRVRLQDGRTGWMDPAELAGTPGAQRI